jgi:squalene-associated FAD-dependent desaturase
VKRVAVIGAGWAGLGCALELAAADRQVTVFESARQAGGRARRVDWNGLAIDNGQHLMIGAYRETLRLLDRLGTRDLLRPYPLELRLPGFRLRLPSLPSPLHLAAGLVSARGLGWTDKLAAVRLIRHLQHTGFKLPRDLPASTLLAQHAQPAELVSKLWEPICVAALNTPLPLASAQVFCNVLRDSLMGPRPDSDFLFARADLGSVFVEPALDYLHRHGGSVRLGQRIEEITPSSRASMAARIDGDDFSHVVWACHPGQLGKLAARLPWLAEAAAHTASYTWQPILTTWLQFSAPLAFPYPMLGLGPGQAPWAFDRSDLRAGLAAIVVSAEGPHLQQTEDQRLQDFLAALNDMLGPLPVLADSQTIIEKRATYTCRPGLPRPKNRAMPGFYLAGDYTEGPYPATLEGAVRSGVKCAHLILEDA